MFYNAYLYRNLMCHFIFMFPMSHPKWLRVFPLRWRLCFSLLKHEGRSRLWRIFYYFWLPNSLPSILAVGEDHSLSSFHSWNCFLNRTGLENFANLRFLWNRLTDWVLDELEELLKMIFATKKKPFTQYTLQLMFKI